MSSTPLVYLMWGRFGHVLYVGRSIDPGARFNKHGHDKGWWRLVHRIELRHCPDNAAAVALERELIERHRPPFNTQYNRAGRPDIHCSECDGLLVWRYHDPANHRSSDWRIGHTTNSFAPPLAHCA